MNNDNKYQDWIGHIVTPKGLGMYVDGDRLDMLCIGEIALVLDIIPNHDDLKISIVVYGADRIDKPFTHITIGSENFPKCFTRLT